MVGCGMDAWEDVDVSETDYDAVSNEEELNEDAAHWRGGRYSQCAGDTEGVRRRWCRDWGEHFVRAEVADRGVPRVACRRVGCFAKWRSAGYRVFKSAVAGTGESGSI